jgi:hypothetical protein
VLVVMEQIYDGSKWAVLTESQIYDAMRRYMMRRVSCFASRYKAKLGYC